MEIKSGIRLSKEEVLDLLTRFDDSSDIPLHEGLDFDSYSEKLSNFAYFILAYSDDNTGNPVCVGFIAYYLNEEGKFVYVPQVVVHKKGRHQGIGHAMFDVIFSKYLGAYEAILLEVLKGNQNARDFYAREGFNSIEDRNDKLLLKRLR